ncbi:AraC family transcriptional regulator [Paenibacillus sp. CC-CFT747]|nr:AraC family transcriptional regulator [Paenibacillus sp. CC-CFT747]
MELETLLIHLIQKLLIPKKSESSLSSVSSQNRDDVLMEQIIRYLSAHLSHNLTVEQVCAQFTLSRSMLTRLFKKSTNSSFIEYLMQMRITEAKRMIREHSYNFTEIGERLGYTSVHYFSKQFKQITGMTPTEYSRSVNALIQDAASERK